jgi:hypothetical protein
MVAASRPIKLVFASYLNNLKINTMLNAYIYDGLRTPFGRHAGALSSIRPDNLAAHVIKALVEKNHLPANIFDDVIR